MMTMSNQAQASATTAVPAITVKDIVVSFEQKDVLKGITWRYRLMPLRHLSDRMGAVKVRS